MKNNKGFTMVELLAVVSIISILSGVASMAVSKYINKTRKDTYKNFENNLKTAAQNYITTHSELALDNTKLNATDLINAGYLENMADPNKQSSNCNKNSYVKIQGTYANQNSYNMSYTYEVCLICSTYKSSTCK